MKKKIFLFPNPDFDRKYMSGLSRIYQIFCKEYDFCLEIIDEDFLKNNKPDENNKDLIVVAGGDGTIHRVINLIPEKYFSAYKFGIISAGTANEFAKSLNLPIILEDAARLIVNYKEQVGYFHKVGIVKNKHKFLTGLLFGIACQVLQSTTNNAKELWGAFAYNIPAFMSLMNFYDYVKLFKMDSLHFQTGYLIINNASLVSKDLPIEDTKIENRDLFSIIYLSPKATPSNILWLLLKNQARLSILNDPSISYTQMNEINLEFDEKTLFMLDGETYEFCSPINIKHYKKNIEIICP